MKNIFLIVAAFIMFLAACKSNNQDNNTISQDTAGLAAFRQQKLLDAQLADQARIDSAAQAKVDQMNAEKASTAAVATRSANKSSAVRQSSRSSSSSARRSSSSSSGTYSRGSNDGYASAPVQTAPERRGISKAAKGAMIGAGTGAVAGAIINKRNRGAGAVIGGVVGGAVGYGVGRSQDKKDGRY
ncbi:YMGG-like glycine zipper-containing protein [Haoranjiania flava]|uniref:YMGG-like glycine zipper-containing protein n=1 Tax=Haoranjiania flava TaxID=1856322 RepID=A0AAE3IR36_9BACT|nr:YMGG-like glycine zipper-containing protein [Haoranjiania flava]MCU7694247.1 YMGG-like glycine zipper-containing protein [Haoranjiania flava]